MIRDRELLVMTGNAHPQLADTIAQELKTDLVNAHVGHYPDGETQVKIMDNVREQDVFVVQPTGPPTNQNLMESLVMIDALSRASAGRITAVIPYFGYARQDRKETSRVPITSKLVTTMFTAAGADRLLAVDLHAHQIQGFTDVPFDHLYARRTIAEAVSHEIDAPVVVAPDIGAGKMVRWFATELDTDWAIVDKDRLDERTTKVAAVIGHNVAGRHALILDDMISTGGSLLKAAATLKDQGAITVSAAATHGVFADNALDRIEASDALDQVYVTDTLPQRNASKLRQITIAPLLARAIANIHEGHSVSELF